MVIFCLLTAVSGDLGNTGNQYIVWCMFLQDYINGLSVCFVFLFLHGCIWGLGEHTYQVINYIVTGQLSRKSINFCISTFGYPGLLAMKSLLAWYSGLRGPCAMVYVLTVVFLAFAVVFVFFSLAME